jgi:hypothetical protein
VSPLGGGFEEAKQWRDLAREQFEAGEWEKAKHLYLKAEDADWSSEGIWKDVAFFSLSTALRCYEEHLLEQDPGLEQEYEGHAERFFNRFSELKRISPSRREEAAKFLAWREHYRDVGPFYFAAIQRGDMDAADQALATAQERLGQAVGPPSETDYWRIVWQSRRECLRARAELLKVPEIRNMTVIADAYEAAARVCVPPDVGDIPEQTRLRIMFYQCMHRSQAERWRANEMLARSRGGFESLNKALGHLTRSVDEAQKATGIGHDRDATSHLEYVSYWKLIVLERVKLLEYVQDRRNEQLHAAGAAIQEAETLARSIVGRVGEERVFPNRFYSVAHLALEPLWLDAIQEFAEGHSGSAAQILSKYCAKLPREFDGSWWHSNVRVRQLAASIMDHWQHDKAGLEAPFGELRNLVDEEGCGAAAETIFEDISLLLRNRKAAVDTQNDILRNWPLDATAEELPEPEQETFRRWVESLPPEICTAFESSSFPGDEQFHSAWVQLLGILLDYYEPLDTDIPRLIRGFSRKTLTHRVLGLPALGRLADASRSLIFSLAADPRANWPQRACLLSLISFHCCLGYKDRLALPGTLGLDGHEHPRENGPFESRLRPKRPKTFRAIGFGFCHQTIRRGTCRRCI